MMASPELRGNPELIRTHVVSRGVGFGSWASVAMASSGRSVSLPRCGVNRQSASSDEASDSRGMAGYS